jgi:spore germination protein
MKASVWGMIVAGGLYFLIVIASVSVFGSEEIKLLLWPTLELAKTTSLPANILERLDAAFLAIWVTAVFTSLFSTYYLTIHSVSKLFRMHDHRPFSFLLLPYLFFLAIVPQNILHMYKIIEWAGQIGLAFTVLYPFLLWLIAVIRRKKGERNDDRRELEPSG